MENKSRPLLKFGCKVKCLFQNGDHALEGRIYAINMDSRTIDVVYDHGIYERNIPMNQSKFILKNESQNDFESFMLNKIIIFPNGKSYMITQCGSQYTQVLPMGNKNSVKMETQSVLRLMLNNRIIEIEEKNHLFSFPTILQSTRNSILYDTSNSGKITKPGYDGPCSGYSIVFSQITPEEPTLECTLIHRKTTINELQPFSNHFIVNTNLHSLPQFCCGTLVAFTNIKTKSTNIEKKESELLWKLGIICHHSLNNTIIVPTYLYHSTNKTNVLEYHLKNNSFHYFNISVNKVSIRYLNHVCVTNKTVNEDNIVNMKLDGPDRVYNFPFTKKQRSVIRKSTQHKSINSGNAFGLGVKYTIPHSILNTMYVSKLLNLTYPKKSLCAEDLSVVNITSPKQLLSTHKDCKLYMVPLDVTSDDGFDFLEEMTYALLKKEPLMKLILFECLPIDEYIYFLKNNCDETITLKIIDPKKLNKNGVLLHYVEANSNKNERSIDISRTTDPYEHCQYTGTILSHWYTVPEHNSIPINDDHLTMMKEVYGCTGFGSRSSIKSIGFNVYTGIKNNSRAIPNPAVLKENTIVSQINRSKFKDTYNPILQSFINELTSQASAMFPLCDRFYNKFILMVRNLLQSTILNNELSKNMPQDKQLHRGPQCVLSILTMGKTSTNTRIDGFINHPHVDRDIFFKTFQETAMKILKEWIETNISLDMKKNILYIQRLHDIGHRASFPLPTSCGYQIVDNHKVSEHKISTVIEESDSFISFALIGLGVTIRIRSNLYHYFYASIVSHCTPVPVTVKNGMVYTYTGLFNIVGWGASSAPSSSSFKQSTKRKR